MSILPTIFRNLPAGWHVVQMDDLKMATRYSFVGGPFGSNLTRSDYVEEPGVPVIRGTNLGGGECRFIDSDFVYVSEAKADSLLQNLAYPGDLVFTQRGTLGQVVEIPKKARFARYVVSQSQMKVAVDERKALSHYIYRYFRSPIATAYLNQRIQATGVPHINLEILKTFPVVLPPLDAQCCIAAILDKADCIRRKREEGIRLTEDLLRSTFLQMFGDPATNPKGWPIRVMRDVVIETQYGTADKSNTDGIGIPVLRMNNITYGGEIDLTDMKRCEIKDANLEQLTVKRGDLLFNRTNSPELVGKTAVWDRDEPYAYAGYLFRVRFDEKVAMPDFVSAFLNSKYGKKMLFAKAKPSNNMSNFSAGEFCRIELPMPDIGIQQRFAKVVSAAREVKRKRKANLDDAEGLFNSLVQRAFRGEL